jgi:hypothetical protein
MVEFCSQVWLADGMWLQDDKATTYTLFCVEQTPPSCVLDTDLPLSFAEGPGTLHFDGVKSGQMYVLQERLVVRCDVELTILTILYSTAHLSCNLAGSTAAACTGSSFYGTGFSEDSITGPTQTVWTKTLTGDEIKWGVLTLTTPPAQAATTNLDDPTPADSATVTAQTSAPSVSSNGRRSLAQCQGTGWTLLAASVGILTLLL